MLENGTERAREFLRNEVGIELETAEHDFDAVFKEAQPYEDMRCVCLCSRWYCVNEHCIGRHVMKLFTAPSWPQTKLWTSCSVLIAECVDLVLTTSRLFWQFVWQEFWYYFILLEKFVNIKIASVRLIHCVFLTSDRLLRSQRQCIYPSHNVLKTLRIISKPLFGSFDKISKELGRGEGVESVLVGACLLNYTICVGPLLAPLINEPLVCRSPRSHSVVHCRCGSID